MQRHLKLIHDIAHGKPARLRSSEWRHVEKDHLAKEPACQWCGATVHLQVHHIKPFHLAPELELDPDNLITLCEEGGYLNCHLIHGHVGSFKNFNPAIREQCDQHRKGPDAKILEEIRTQDPELFEFITLAKKLEKKHG